MTEFTSDRLLFRTLSQQDVSERYVAWLNDPEVNRYLETRFEIQTSETCRRFVAAVNADPSSHLFGIFEQQGGRHVGNIKLGFIRVAHASGQLSLLIGERSCWGRGYATEAIRAVSRWGFHHLGLERIEAGCYDENLASLRAFLKVGYTIEGYHRKSVAFDGRRIGSFWMGLLKHELPS